MKSGQGSSCARGGVALASEISEIYFSAESPFSMWALPPLGMAPFVPDGVGVGALLVAVVCCHPRTTALAHGAGFPKDS